MNSKLYSGDSLLPEADQASWTKSLNNRGSINTEKIISEESELEEGELNDDDTDEPEEEVSHTRRNVKDRLGFIDDRTCSKNSSHQKVVDWSNNRVLLVGDERAASCDWTEWNYFPSVDVLHKWDADVQDCCVLADQHLYKGYDVVGVMAFHYDIADCKQENCRSFKRLLKIRSKVNYSKIVSVVDYYSSRWQKIYPETIVVWILPYPPDFAAVNRRLVDPMGDSFEDKLFNSFTVLYYNSVLTLMNYINRIHYSNMNIFNLSTVLFDQKAYLLKTFHSGTRPKFPDGYLRHGMYPTKLMTMKFAFLLVEHLLDAGFFPKMKRLDIRKAEMKLIQNFPEFEAYLESSSSTKREHHKRRHKKHSYSKSDSKRHCSRRRESPNSSSSNSVSPLKKKQRKYDKSKEPNSRDEKVLDLVSDISCSSVTSLSESDVTLSSPEKKQSRSSEDCSSQKKISRYSRRKGGSKSEYRESEGTSHKSKAQEIFISLLSSPSPSESEDLLCKRESRYSKHSLPKRSNYKSNDTGRICISLITPNKKSLHSEAKGIITPEKVKELKDEYGIGEYEEKCLETLEKGHHSECEYYRQNPTQHPAYFTEKMSFHKRHSDSGVSGSSSIQKQWLEFWSDRMEELFLESWHSKAKEFLREITQTKESEMNMKSANMKKDIETDVKMNVCKDLFKELPDTDKTLFPCHSISQGVNILKNEDAARSSTSAIVKDNALHPRCSENEALVTSEVSTKIETTTLSQSSSLQIDICDSFEDKASNLSNEQNTSKPVENCDIEIDIDKVFENPDVLQGLEDIEADLESALATDYAESCFKKKDYSPKSDIRKVDSFTEKENKGENSEFSQILNLLFKLSKHLGSFASPITDLYHSTLNCIIVGKDPTEKLDEEARSILHLAHSKLQRVLKDDLCIVQRVVISEVTERLALFLNSLPPKFDKFPNIEIRNIAEATIGKDVSQIVQFIKSTLLSNNYSDFTSDDIMKIYMAVRAAHLEMLKK